MVPCSPTAIPVLASTKETARRVLAVPLCWGAQVLPPSSVYTMAPASPTAVPPTGVHERQRPERISRLTVLACPGGAAVSRMHNASEPAHGPSRVRIHERNSVQTIRDRGCLPRPGGPAVIRATEQVGGAPAAAAAYLPSAGDPARVGVHERHPVEVRVVANRGEVALRTRPHDCGRPSGTAIARIEDGSHTSDRPPRGCVDEGGAPLFQALGQGRERATRPLASSSRGLGDAAQVLH